MNNYISPILNEMYHDFFVNSLTLELNTLNNTLSVILIVYCTILVIIFLSYWILFQNRIVYDIIYSKTTLLLIHPSDIKEIKTIMNFLRKEVLKVKNNN